MFEFAKLKTTPDFKPKIGGEFTKIEQEKLSREILEKMYLRRETLGKGKAGEVWFCDDPAFGEKLCVKTNHNNNISINDPSKEFDLQQEFHDAGVRVPKVWMLIEGRRESEEEMQDFIIMETIDGLNLEELIDKMVREGKKFTNKEYQKIKADLEQQINIAHQSQLYHRDLHFKNVMIDKNLNVFLVDFGDAASVFSSSEDSEIYRADTVRNGKPIQLIYPKDENIIEQFHKEVIKRNLIKTAA